MEGLPLPVVDLSLGDEEIAKTIFQAMSSSGFCILRNHGVPMTTFEGVYTAHRAFHDLPLEDKMVLRSSVGHRGYMPINTSTLHTSDVAQVKKPNQSESFIVSGGVYENTPTVVAGPTPWPSLDEAIFKDPVERYHTEIKSVCHKLVPLVALSLGLPRDTFEPHFHEPTSWLRLLCYPPHPTDAPADLFGSAPHSDYGFITLVSQENIGGLQVLYKEQWHNVEPVLGDFIMNCGDMLSRWTNGIYKATPHRVINRSHTEKRYSVVFFFDCALNTDVKPLLENGDVKKEPVNYGAYLVERLEKNYQRK